MPPLDDSIHAHENDLEKVVASLIDPETTSRVEAFAEFLGAVTGMPLSSDVMKAITKRLLTTPVQARLDKEIATLERAERMREALRPLLREFAERTHEEIRAGLDLDVALSKRLDGLHEKIDQLMPSRLQRHDAMLAASSDAARARGDLTAYKEFRRVRRDGVPLAENSSLANRYAILKKLGTGGFADVWLARELANEQRLVALKVLHHQYVRDETRRERFFRGARKQAELNSHPHIVSILEKRCKAEGYHFFVMEFVDGSTLQAAGSTGLSVAKVRRIITDIGNALTVAHHKGSRHRDVKPSNILLDVRGRALLTDFDLVAAHDTTGGTRTGALGTFMFAPPEMLENAKDVDERADQYGLAMSAVYALYPKPKLPPQILREPEAVIEGLEIPPRARAVLARAVNWKADKRYPTMARFIRAFRNATEEPASSHARAASPPTPREFSRHARRLMGRLDESERVSLELRGRGEQLTAIAAALRVDGEGLLRTLSAARERLLDLALDEGLSWPETTMLFAPGCSASSTDDGDWIADAYRRASSGDDPRPGWRWGWAPPSVAPASIKAAAKLETGDDIYGTWLRFTVDELIYTMRWIPPGEFIMGSPEDEPGRHEREGPPHLVRLTRGFWLGETLCTEALWSALMTASPPARSKLPATGMDGAGCETFLGRLNERVPGLRARLAREAEWEYACRAGTQGTRYGELNEIAWHADNSDARKHDVGLKQANAWGLRDMLGNVWEWCGEGRREYTSELQVDPVGPPALKQREARGGSYNGDDRGTRAAYRRGYHTGDRIVRLGFRIASDHHTYLGSTDRPTRSENT